MTPERIEQERNAFEEWFYENICGIQLPLNKSEIGRYCNFYAEDMFTAWCAAKSHAEQSEWISVEDSLPDIETPVLVCNERGEIFSSWASDVDVFWFYLEEDDNRITHWQPLPAPPTTNPAA